MAMSPVRAARGGRIMVKRNGKKRGGRSPAVQIAVRAESPGKSRVRRQTPSAPAPRPDYLGATNCSANAMEIAAGGPAR
jgi:hypothetical protein